MKRMMVLMMLVTGSLIGLLTEDGSCARPWPGQVDGCRAMEAAILSATVRLTIHGRIEVEDGYEVQVITGTTGHATVTGGRYLISHNHFGLPLSQVLLYNRHAGGGLSGVSVYRLDGTAVLDHGPISAFEVVAEQGETTVLDFGEGFFDRAGVASAAVAAGDGLAIAPGQEVALVDWDGRGQTRVVWAEIVAAYKTAAHPAGELGLIQVDHGIQVGASGGGVFLNGVHVGNNWGLVVRPAAGEGGGPVQRTLVAVNGDLPAQVMALLAGG
jgi:hypothetical protein